MAQDQRLQLDDLEVAFTRTGAGLPVLLLHGFPHTKEIWQEVTPLLVTGGHEVVAVDLRGAGASSCPPDGYAAVSLAADQVRLLDALGISAAHIVGFDYGAAAAFAMATKHPDRVASLTVVEALISGVSSGERSAAPALPWWFGFHQAPGGLAEEVICGHEQQYIEFFLTNGSRRGLPEDLLQHLISAYTGRDRLRAAFEHYRAIPANGDANSAWATKGRLRMPVTAVVSTPVGDVLKRQLQLLADSFTYVDIADSGHIVPVDAPEALSSAILSTAHR